jgi:hypothetical protein
MESNLRELLALKTVIEELGYSTTLQKSDEDLSLDVLSIALGDEDSEKADGEEVLTLAIFPLEDLEGSVFVQFYTQYPFILNSASLPSIVAILPDVNNRLPLGHFNLSQDKTRLYFRYVLALPLHYQATPDFLNDVLDMCIFSYEQFFEYFESLSSG